MALKDITITGSIGSIPTQSYGQKTYISSTDEQSFPIEQFKGGTGGIFPNLEGNISSSNLIVNITQSWSGSINTPSGIVQFVHNTQEEFYNGEFSGSNLTVTDQRLSDEQTIEFLYPDTTLVNYKPYFYYASGSNAVSLNNFLLPYTSPNDGEMYLYYSYTTFTFAPGSFFPPGTFVIPTGVVYAKIAKNDAFGNDNTLSLQELIDFNILFSDAGLTQYKISTITEYIDYYLYQINTNIISSSTDNNILDHKLIATSFTPNILPTSPGLWLFSNWTSTSDPLNYFSNSGLYTFNDTPNIPIEYTASITFTTVAPSTPSFDLFFYKFNLNTPSSPQIILTTASLSPNFPAGTYTVVLSGSTNEFIDGDNCYVASTAIQMFNVTVNLNITQSVSPNFSSNVIALNPYIVNNFLYSDSNVLFNNAEIITPSNFYRRIIYDNGSITPSNYKQIMSQSAEFADVKDYYYYLQRQLIPRYIGSKSTSPNFNLNTTVGGYGNLPNVEKNSTYFAAVNNIGTSDPEIVGSSIATLKFLIDTNADTFELNNDPTEISYYNATFTFEQDRSASLSNQDGDIYFSKIRKSGYDVFPIIYSDIGINYVNTLSFGSGDVGDYLLNSNVQGLYGQSGASYVGGSAFFNGAGRVNRDDNNSKGFFLRFYNLNNSPESNLVSILSGSVPSSYKIQFGTSANQGGDGDLEPLTTGSFYHIINQIPNTNLKFRLQPYAINFGFSNIYSSNTFYSTTSPAVFELNISIIKTKFQDLNVTGSIYEWDARDFTKTTTLVTHKYICTISSLNSNISTATVTIIDQGNVINSFTRQFTTNRIALYTATLPLETDFLSTFVVDDVIGIYYNLTSIPPLGTMTISPMTNIYQPASFDVLSDPTPNILVITSGSLPFFSTASGNPYRLIATSKSLDPGDPALSTGLAQVLNQGLQYPQNYITGSGYKPFKFNSCSPKIGDEIRFEHKEAYSYKIIGLGNSGSNNDFYMDLDQPVVAGTNLDWFLIRRYVKNPSKMILSTDNSPTSGGFIYPEYISKELTDKIPQIIQKLKIQNLI